MGAARGGFYIRDLNKSTSITAGALVEKLEAVRNV